MTSLLSIVVREIREILDHRQVLLVLVIAPFMYALFYPQPYLAETLRNVPIEVVDLDGTVASRDLVRNLAATPELAVVSTGTDFAEAERRVYARQISGIVVLPEGFERDLLHDRPSSVVLYADSSYFLIYLRLSSAVRAVTQTMGTQVEISRLTATGMNTATARLFADPLDLTMVPLFNPQGGYATYVLPAAFVLIVQQILMMGIGMLEPRRRGLDARARRHSLVGALSLSFDEVVGRMIAYLMIEAVIVPFYFVVLPHLYGLPRLGSISTILLLSIPFVIAVAGLGLTIGALIHNSLAVQLAMGTLGMPLFFLAGFSWPMQLMPPVIYECAKVIPSTTAIDAFVRVSQLGAGWAEIAPEVQTLIWLAAGFFVLAVLTNAERHYTHRADAKRH